MKTSKDMIGKRYNKLVVLEQTDRRENKYCVWKCQCDCGNIVYVNTRKLNRGTVISCGCEKKKFSNRGNKPEDITGQVFGDLTAVKKVDSKNGRTRWLCKCKCGNETIVNTHELKSGKVKSCGCRRHRKGLRMKDLTGQRFGRLVAMYPTDRRDYKLSVYWHCKCDCGNEVEVTQAGLISGNYKSCGCLKKEVNGNINKKLHMVDNTCIEFIEKRKERKDNTSGFRGVYKTKTGYSVKIGFRGKRYYVGTYKDYESAVNARKEAEETLHEKFLEAYYKWSELAKADPQWGNDNPLIFEVEKVKNGFKIYCNVD